MANMWDINQPNPVSGRKSKGKKQKRTKKASEQDMSSGVNQIVKTAGEFTMGAMGIAVMSNMGTSVISALAKK